MVCGAQHYGFRSFSTEIDAAEAACSLMARVGDLIPNPKSPIAGLYVHVPFCTSICNYCNFNRGLFDEGLKNRFVQAVRREIRNLRPHFSALASTTVFDSLYFGGGTPSLLAPAEIKSIIDESRESFGLLTSAEITLEANPESVNPESLEQFRSSGVNRLSFG